ncbi:MAG: DUF1311 domain-containing protein [Synergistaceae bacterium]|nr:DUF1311 domain-containing protein [Synergistaceae bacterium]
MKRIFAVLALLLVAVSPAFALSDEEYLTLKKSNADFAKADRRLAQVWKELKADLYKDAFAELQKNQREWIESGRDEEAEDLMSEGYSKAEAYTIATNNRADELPDIAVWVERNLGLRQ